ncbi:MAG TPA: right-handed parallel beta-helix repeat-containing protein [Chthoniobacterales bacterium]|nr:right-handed parallel beta-helix repeat-containing protein [Chthoniobacterales bacterium]
MIKSTTRFLATAFLVCGFASFAHAQATRTWVSGVGDDVNPCSRTAPCKTFAGAISKTADKGEISVLDPGGFGTVTITKSITINGTGTLAGILSAGSPSAITVNDVNAAVPNSSVVIIRDVSMNGAGTGTSGARLLSGKTLMLDHCWIYGMTSRGVDVSKTADGNLKMIDTVIENVGEDGVHITTTAGTVFGFIDHSRITNCTQDGIEAISNVRLSVSNSQVFKAGGAGIHTSAANSIINLDDVLVAQCDVVGVRSSASSAINVSDTNILNNPIGILQNGGTIASFQGNSLIGNTTPGSFSPTTAKQ